MNPRHWHQCFFHRCPTGRATATLGSDIVDLDDAAILDVVQCELRTTMAITATPILSRIYRHKAGIAQYTVGHQQRIDDIEQRLAADLPGLWVAGSSYYGVSMNACIERASKQAQEIIGALS